MTENQRNVISRSANQVAIMFIDDQSMRDDRCVNYNNYVRFIVCVINNNYVRFLTAKHSIQPFKYCWFIQSYHLLFAMIHVTQWYMEITS